MKKNKKWRWPQKWKLPTKHENNLRSQDRPKMKMTPKREMTTNHMARTYSTIVGLDSLINYLTRFGRCQSVVCLIRDNGWWLSLSILPPVVFTVWSPPCSNTSYREIIQKVLFSGNTTEAENNVNNGTKQFQENNDWNISYFMLLSHLSTCCFLQPLSTARCACFCLCAFLIDFSF